MAQVLGVLTATGLIVALELPSLRKKKLKKELWVFWLLLLAGTAFNLAEALHFELPNPIDWLGLVFRPVGKALQELFH